MSQVALRCQLPPDCVLLSFCIFIYLVPKDIIVVVVINSSSSR